MSILREQFETIEKKDLLSLIENSVPEGRQIEYKSSSYGLSDDDRKEFLKDVSSFSNSSGGHIVLGMKEEEGLPFDLVGLPGIDIDAEILRLENLIRDAIEPRIFGVQFRRVQINTEVSAIVGRIPRSWNAPHRVKFRNTNRFYIRNSAGVHECDVSELRVLFNSSAEFEDRVQVFRKDRVTKILSDQGPVPTIDDGRLIVHIVPMSAFQNLTQVDLREAYRLATKLSPMGHGGYFPRFNLHGFLNTDGSGAAIARGYTQVFRNGIVEAVMGRFLPTVTNSKVRALPSGRLEERLLLPISNYLLALENLAVPPPFVVLTTMTNTDGGYLAIGGIFNDDHETTFVDSEFWLPPVVIDDYGKKTDYYRAMRPVLDAIWNAGGHSHCSFFDQDGNFAPPR